jgi:hypothetical protein
MKTVNRILTVLLVVISYAVTAHTGTIDLPRTGQTVCTDAAGKIVTCAGTGQDGDKQAGNPWPVPRFTDNNNGTVTDNLTGLVWLRNANCFGGKVWADAITAAAGLASGVCSLTDGSKVGDWRIPNINELRSLVDYSRKTPALAAGHPFYYVHSTNAYSESYYYWSSSNANIASNVVALTMNHGGTIAIQSGYPNYVWPVRSGL